MYQKILSSKWKDNPQNEKKKLANHKFDKGLISRIYKKSQNSVRVNKQLNLQLGNVLKQMYFQEAIQISSKHMKDAQNH